MRSAPGDSPLVAWLLLIAGILSTAYAWQFRQPLPSSDFRIFYVSAQNPPERMYTPLPGARDNMNPPQFQLLMRPLTAVSLPAASTIFRTVSFLCLGMCLWWLSRTSREPWTIADIGALLSWVPMASVISLNQVTWILWPLLMGAWWLWRQDRWTSGAIAFGVALSLKPFLGVFLLWLIVTRRWRAASTAIATAAAAFFVAVLAYGVEVLPAWLGALNNVRWWWAVMNASIQSWVARVAAPEGAITFMAPRWVTPLAAVFDVLLITFTLVRTRNRTIDQSWRLLMIAALLASPLGWLYYIWWVLPGSRPVRILFHSPMLWVPWAYITARPPNRFVAASVASVYFWGLLVLWVHEFRTAQRAV